MSDQPNGPICDTCHNAKGELEIRKRYICVACFVDYVGAKVSRRMEPYRIRSPVGKQTRKLLLPLSGGISSLVLLHVLDSKLKRQTQKYDRTAYHLITVHVQGRMLSPNTDDSQSILKTIADAFPAPQYLPTVTLNDIFALDGEVEIALNELGIVRNAGEEDASLVSRLFAAAKTATAKADLDEVLLQRLLVGVAKRHGCDGILWAHSDSRLAAKTLADVAQGRGGSTSTMIADGPSRFGLDFVFPLRELYKSELESYFQIILQDMPNLLQPELKDTTKPSIRNTSIEALLNNYIASQGEKYPSIMANVVRTTGKLQHADMSEGPRCKICLMPSHISATSTTLCYGCARLKQDIQV